MFAHDVGGGALPAPPWLLSYIGAAFVFGTAAALRASWPTARLSWTTATADPIRPPARVGPGPFVGLVVLAATLYAALAGPDSSAANIAPVAVLVVWWVGLPLACLVLGDVVRHVNPFVAVVAVLQRTRAPDDDVSPRPTAPTWTSAAFLAAFSWYFLAYHRPGSPRSLALFLLVYAGLAVAGGLHWGRAWLAAGDAFAGLSAAVARIGLRRPTGPAPAGTAALMVVWLGGTGFDAFSSTPFWSDVLGTSRGWSRTMINSVGLLWITAVVAGAVLVVVRLAERGQEDPGRRLTVAFGVALVPLATGWFVSHDLTLLLFEGQNFYALLSDPLGRGWDLFGTLTHTIDYQIVQSGWVGGAQIAALVAGHVATVVLVHDRALSLLRRRPAMRTTWAMAVAAAASIAAAALLVLT